MVSAERYLYKNGLTPLNWRREHASSALSRVMGTEKGGLERIPWDEYWMNIVYDVARRSTCLRRQIGALVVKKNIIISTGYNGAPRGFPHCLDIGCRRDQLNIASGERHEECVGVHAEQNALLQAGRDAEDATLYVNAFPCKICAKLIINARIRRVVISGDYSDREGLDFLNRAGVKLTFMEQYEQIE